MKQRFAIGSLKDRAAFAKILRDPLPVDLSAISLMGSCRHWPRNIGSEEKPDSLDELFFLEGEAVRCTGGIVHRLLSSRAVAGADSLKAALQKWILPPHVDRLAAELAAGKLLIWIPITAPEQECSICLALLRTTRSVVQIHDFEADHELMTRKGKGMRYPPSEQSTSARSGSR
jgi:hypothetical protein